MALAFLLLFSAGYIVGSTPRNALYNSVTTFALRSWQTGLLRSFLLSVVGLTGVFSLLLLLGERAASVEEQGGRSGPREHISAREHLRRRGSF